MNNNTCNIKTIDYKTILFTGTMLDISYFARTSTAGK